MSVAVVLKGAPVAAAISEELSVRVERLKEAGRAPALAIVRVGDRPDDVSYESGALKRCEKIGIHVRRFHLPSGVGRGELLQIIRDVNADDSIHGCLVLRPLPDRETEREVCGLLRPEKDVDCITPGALGSVFIGYGDGYPPCTAEACLAILDYYQIPIAGKRAVVIGRSLVIGRPVAMLLQGRNATVTVCHTKTAGIPALCADADILIAAAGQREMVDGSYASPNQVVIDVGIHVDEATGKLCGDVCYDEMAPIVSAITPVPGGVGAVTAAILARHTVEAAERSE